MSELGSSGKQAIQGSLRKMGWPIVVGAVISVAFYALLHAGLLGSSLNRYLAGHWIEYTEVTLFFMGMAAICLRGMSLLQQWALVTRITLAPAQEGGHDYEHAGRLVSSLEKLPAHARETYLVQRWTDALRQICLKNTADGLDDELKYLADMDAARMHEGYSLVRIIIWATPMLGFLGTVMGITLALGELSPEALVNTPKEAMEGLLAGLSIAFDTTSVALTLSIAMMFAQFLSVQSETNLLAYVDRRTNEELVGRFRQMGSGRDPAVAAVQRMSQSVVQVCEQLVTQQAQIWNQSQQENLAHMAQWWHQARTELAHVTHQELRTSVQHYVDGIREVEAGRRAELQAWQDQLQQMSVVGAERFARQQESLERQIQQFDQAMQHTQHVLQLEEALRLNLDTLAGTHHFEETLMSLSAAIHLLSARLGGTADSLPRRQSTTGQAA